MSEERLTRVESEVSTIRDEMGGIKSEVTGLKTQMAGFGGILQRIDQAIAAQAQRFDDDKQASRINPIAVVTVIITVMSMMVGGAYLVGSNQGTMSERTIAQQHQLDLLWAERHAPPAR